VQRAVGCRMRDKPLEARQIGGAATLQIRQCAPRRLSF
jgi:hypothetical protein